MEDAGNDKENIPIGPSPKGFGRPAFSSGARGSSMYDALGSYNAEQRQKQLKILAEEDLVAHLTSVRKSLQDQNEELRKTTADLRLKHQVSESENQTIKSKKEAVQKEIQENEATLAEMQERLAKKHMLIDKLKTARDQKQKQFAILMQRRQEFYDAVFEESPEGQMYAQLKQEVKRSQELLKNRQSKLSNLESTYKLKLKEQKEHWEDFKKKCVKFAEHAVRKTQDHSKMDGKNTAPAIEKFSSGASSGWDELYYQMTVPAKKQRLMQLPSMSIASLNEMKRQLQSQKLNRDRDENGLLGRPFHSLSQSNAGNVSFPFVPPMTPVASVAQQTASTASEGKNPQSRVETSAGATKDDDGFFCPSPVPCNPPMTPPATPQRTPSIASKEKKTQSQNEEARDDDGFLRPGPVSSVPSATLSAGHQQTLPFAFEVMNPQPRVETSAGETEDDGAFFPHAGSFFQPPSSPVQQSDDGGIFAYLFGDPSNAQPSSNADMWPGSGSGNLFPNQNSMIWDG